MTLGYAVQSVFEVLGVIALVLGMIFDDKIARWEKRMIYRIRKKLFGTRSNVIPFNSVKNDGRVG